jgi:tetratricopeptide (TPR) repeat protein
MDYYRAGGGALLSAGIPLTAMGNSMELAAEIDTAYSLIPLPAVSNSLSLVRGTGGLRATVPVGDRFRLFGFGGAGGYFGTINGASSTGYGFAARGGLGASLELSQSISLSAGAAYQAHFGLYNGINAFVGTSFDLGGSGRAPTRGPSEGVEPEPLPASEQTGALSGEVTVTSTELTQMFPVLYKYYDDNPLGTATIANETGQPVENVEVRFDAERIIDNPKLSAEFERLAAGESREVDLYALFNDQVLNFTEGTKIAARVTLDYRALGERLENAHTVTLSTYDRNALRWDDDRKVAAFVTSKDSEIQSISKNVAAVSRQHRVDAVNNQFQMAMAQLAAMRERGLSYVVDPNSSYEVLSQNPQRVDYVQFPRQTFDFGSGDCDDLSSAYAALLESVGVSTAFITIPGHLFMAFQLDMTPTEARSAFAHPNNLIFREDGSVWVPVETTVLQDGFMEAWETGARQWREHAPSGDAGFFRTHQAWKTYQPVAFSVSDTELAPPERDEISSLFQQELESFVNQQIESRQQELLARLEQNPEDLELRNRIGVLYARHGKHDQAKEHFQQIVETEPFAPAYVNLGNIAFLRENFERAREYYAQALEENPNSSAASLGRARVANRLENYEVADEQYERLSSLNPNLADRFRHLDPQQGEQEERAGSAAQTAHNVVWGETQE